MTDNIQKQFFETFGIEPMHEDACKLADKYWGNEELAKEYYVFDIYMEKNCPMGGKECFSTCKNAYDNIEYPEITDRILLELICIDFNENPYKCRGGQTSVDEVKERILSDFIHEFENDLYLDKENVKQKVQELF